MFPIAAERSRPLAVALKPELYEEQVRPVYTVDPVACELAPFRWKATPLAHSMETKACVQGDSLL